MNVVLRAIFTVYQFLLLLLTWIVAWIVQEIAKIILTITGAKKPAKDWWCSKIFRALNQIVINLINNAIKYTEAGKVVVELSRRNDLKHSYVEVSVSDTGSGIRAEDQAKLFQAFSQLDSSSTRQFEGTGLMCFGEQE